MWDRVRARGEVGQEEAVRHIVAVGGSRLIAETAHGGSLCYEVRKAFARLHGGRARFVPAPGGRRWVLVPDSPGGQAAGPQSAAA
jgi:hypothetical protein